MKKVAIQGVVGSFHDVAAQALFENDTYQVVPCASFDELFTQLKNDPQMYAVMAIENTSVGGLLQNYNLLLHSSVKIVAEYKLRIEHSLLALEGQGIEDITEVHSHPMALLQCSEFLSQYPHLRAVEADDTAASAERIAQGQIRGRAAIANIKAGKNLGLICLKEGIETNKHNYTRFLKLSQQELCEGVTNKASIAFCLTHEVGSLAKVLNIWLIYGVSLTKIQSMPIVGQEWRYRFFVDIVYDDYNKYTQSLVAVGILTEELIVLGEYVTS